MAKATVQSTAADERWRLFARPPYSSDRQWKRTVFRDMIVSLTRHHSERCLPYSRILKTMNFQIRPDVALEELPFMPTGLFKRMALASVAESAETRVLHSSGTSGTDVSRILLDKTTSLLQMRALTNIVTDLVGTRRLPLLIVDSPQALVHGEALSARAVAIQGFSLFGAGRRFALTQNLKPDLVEIQRFLDSARDGPCLVFGMTSTIWQHFFSELRQRGIRLDFAEATLIHGGGWKTMTDAGVSDADFRAAALELTGARRVFNYYGMVEQSGSIYMQCLAGFLHSSTFSDVFTRRPRDFALCDHGEPGILQTLSVLPQSYPGHSLLTEDEGVVCGEDDCLCGRRGKYFVVTRRLPSAEAKGCGDASDTVL